MWRLGMPLGAVVVRPEPLFRLGVQGAALYEQQPEGSTEYLFREICVCLGGLSAERLFFGPLVAAAREKEQGRDLRTAGERARAMARGGFKFEKTETQEQTAKRIISLAAEKTEEMLRKEIVVVDELAEALLSRRLGVLQREDILVILGPQPKTPPKMLPLLRKDDKGQGDEFQQKKARDISESCNVFPRL